MKTILTPLDFSRVSESVVKEAATLAHALDARIVLFTAVQPPVVLTEYAAYLDIAKISAAGEKNAVRMLRQTEQKLKAESIPVESVQSVGSPVDLITEEAERWAADYIVMGSHGHTAFYDLLVGSTTHGVLKRARCPVVIVPAPQREAEARRKKARRDAG